MNNNYAIYLDWDYEQSNLDRNYYDVANPSSETDVASQIGDICGGAPLGFATYWPWYISPIDFAQAKTGTFPTTADLATANSPTCTGADNHPEITGSKLGVIYNNPANLSLVNSPYYVVSNVIITSTLTVENGVAIIFAGSYVINVKGGTIDMCDASVDSDTFNSRGTVTGFTPTTVRGDYSNGNYTTPGRSGSIRITSNGDGTFCNVIFNEVDQAIYTDGDKTVMIDNCVFNNSNYGFNAEYSNALWSSNGQHQITDSICDNTDYCVTLRGAVMDNCEFTNFMYDPIVLRESNNVTNCLIVGDYNNGASNSSGMYDSVRCIHVQEYANNITRNTIRNCETAIYMYANQIRVNYNDFENNKLAIQFVICCSSTTVAVNYNNFVNNDFNMESQYDIDGCNYNYYGTVNEAEIAATIKDICNGYGSGLITWWPYYVSSVSPGTTLPGSNDIVNPTCNGPDNHPGFNPRLNVLYFGDATLTTGIYYVTNDVKIGSGATLHVENGVELIFLSDYNIVVNGAIEIGDCDGGPLNNQGNIRGILFANKVTIKGDSVGQYNGCIRIDSGYGRFCNAVFQDLRCGVESNYNADGAIVDNCVFDNVDSPVKMRANNGGNKITDSDFIDCGYECITADGDTTIFNNIIRHFSQYGIQLQNNNNYGLIDVSFTDIVFTEPNSNSNVTAMNYQPVGIYTSAYEGTNITHCIFENLYQGLYLNANANISWNDFNNNKRGIYISSYGNTINYNNFDNCTYNIEVQTSSDVNVKYNWNGDVNNIDSVADVASKMADTCNNNDCCFGSGRAVFEPYFGSVIDTANEDYSIPEMLSFEFMSCSDYSWQASSTATFVPSSSPTVPPPACPTTVGTIICDETMTSTVPESEEECWIFQKNDNLQATFSTCGSDFPTSLRVYDSSNKLISDSYCPNQDPMYDSQSCDAYKCAPSQTYGRQVFTIPALSQGTYYVKVGSPCCKSGSGEYHLNIICGETPAPTLPTLTDLTGCESTVQGFVSDYIDDLYFDVGTIGYGETVGFNACPSNIDGFNMFEFKMLLYQSDSFIGGSVQSTDSWEWDSRVRCGNEYGYGTYLEYTNMDNYNGTYILKIDSWSKNGGSYQITKECNVSATTLTPTSAPTNMVITDTLTCGQTKTGMIGHGEQIYYKIPSSNGIDFSSSCNMTFVFDACPQDTPYVNQIEEFNIWVFEIYNISASNNTMEHEDSGGGSDGINKRGLWNYGDTNSNNHYCDITNNNYEPNGAYYRFTDTDCSGQGPANLYLQLNTHTDFDFGNKFDYSIEFKCDTPIITTPAPTLPTGAETMRCGDTKTGQVTDSEIFYALNFNDLNNGAVAFEGCSSDFDTRLTVYELCDGCDFLSDWTSRSNTPRYCNDNEDGTYFVFDYGVFSGYSYFLGIQYEDGGYTGECTNCNYDITMECSTIQETTEYPTETDMGEITPAPTQIGTSIDCSTRDLLGNLKNTNSLRNTYPFHNTQKQFVLFAFCSMAYFSSTIKLYQGDIDNKYDIIARDISDEFPGEACQNITGYFDSGYYWLSIEPRYDWDGLIEGLPLTGEPKYLLNVYCDAQANAQIQNIQKPKANMDCNYVQISKQKAPMPIGVCNTKYPKDIYDGRYSYMAECKSGNNGLQVTICPNSENCSGASCFTVDASLESDCSNDATLCDLTVYDYNCQAPSTCQYTTIRSSAITGNIWDYNFDPNTCTRDDTFYETTSMVIDDCYVKKAYGWITGTIGCDGLQSITMNDYLIPFGTNPTNFCSTSYKYNTTTIYNGGCIFGSYTEITYCPYTAKPTLDTAAPSTKPTKDPTRYGDTYKPTPSPTPLPTRSPLLPGQTHQPTPSPSDVIATFPTEETDEPTMSQRPTSPPTIDVVATASYPYSFVLSIIIGFVAVVWLW